jgi:hypothetical protein
MARKRKTARRGKTVRRKTSSGSKARKGETVKGRSKRSSKKKKSSGRKRPMNPYMKALQKARKEEAPSFTYNGKTYKRAYAKTGMAIYKGV